MRARDTPPLGFAGLCLTFGGAESSDFVGGDGAIAFDDSTGQVSGSWVTGRPPAADANLLLYIMVDDIAAALDAVVANGGKIVLRDAAKPPVIAARFSDPAGNVLGLYQEG